MEIGSDGSEINYIHTGILLLEVNRNTLSSNKVVLGAFIRSYYRVVYWHSPTGKGGGGVTCGDNA